MIFHFCAFQQWILRSKQIYLQLGPRFLEASMDRNSRWIFARVGRLTFATVWRQLGSSDHGDLPIEGQKKYGSLVKNHLYDRAMILQLSQKKHSFSALKVDWVALLDSRLDYDTLEPSHLPCLWILRSKQKIPLVRPALQETSMNRHSRWSFA